MKKLTQQTFDQAKSFILNHGRTLDQRLFEYHFESGSKEAVRTALSPYQNGDGGFGQALEPDLRTPISSAVVTSQGLYILREVNEPAMNRWYNEP